MSDSEMDLIKYNKKTWCKSALLGFFIGLAVIVPGISGSTVAIIFKLYDQFLYALGNLFKKFKACFTFLLPIGLGLLVGVLLGFITVQQLLDLLPFAIVCLFAGLMCGAFPAVKDELKGAQFTAKRIVLFTLGLCIPVALGCVSALMSTKSVDGASDVFADVAWWHALLAILIGAVVGITQIVPGLSASAFLMAVGWFSSLVDSVSMTYWKSNPSVFFVYAGLAIGFLIGLFAFSKLLTYLFSVARHTAYSMIVGLSLGSILSMFCNGDIVEVYASWAINGAAWLDIALGVVLLAAGVIGAYRLVCYQRKKDAEETEDGSEKEVVK
ncbi:MAG: DUF368 domain-containing protein [Clostridia bacterium]|nr:DUF368 domain-containing protein [Clostridia bacterium]